MNLEELSKDIQSKCTRCVLSLSGGLDSTTLAYLLVHALGKDNVAAVSFNYNQRHDVELQMAKKSAEKLGIRYMLIDISGISNELAENTGLIKTSKIKIPSINEILGDPQPQNIYVPYRNMLMSTYLFIFAEHWKFDSVSIGIQTIDEYHFWDCTSSFVDSINKVSELNRKFNIQLITPISTMSKRDIVVLGKELNVPFEDTWTCYNPKIKGIFKKKYEPCNVCPSCSIRNQAIQGK